MDSKGSVLVKIIIIIFIMIIIIIGIAFLQNRENTNEVAINSNVTDTNVAKDGNTENSETLDVESWRKKLWDYFTDYEN